MSDFLTRRRHDLYFSKEIDAKKAFDLFAFYIPGQVRREVYQTSFFTSRPLTILEQVTVLMHVNAWQAFFNLQTE